MVTGAVRFLLSDDRYTASAEGFERLDFEFQRAADANLRFDADTDLTERENRNFALGPVCQFSNGFTKVFFRRLTGCLEGDSYG